MTIVANTGWQSPQQITLQHLATSQYDFYLTGSRHFGGWCTDSDWDFFADGSSAPIRSFLAQMKFEREVNEDNPYLGDPFNCEVWYHGTGIHVQLVDVDRKQATQMIITKYFGDVYRITPKEQRRLLWRGVDKMLAAGASPPAR